jgi:autotransporter-associated beta strand protein
LAGTGSVGDTTVKSGGIISPGNSPGTLSVESLTLEGGGIYKWELANATGSTPGTDWDFIVVGGGSGTVTLSATTGNPFIIDLRGNPSNWDPTNNYTWEIISMGTISGFNAAAFTVDTNNFTGAAPTGSWLFSTNETHLLLTYTNISGDPTYSNGSGLWGDGFDPSLTTGLNALFTGASGGTATNNIAAAALSAVGDLIFTDTAGAYTLVADTGAAGVTGTPLIIAGNIVNESAATQTINMALEFDSTRTIDADAGNMVFGGAISNVGGMLVTGASSNTFTGVISGAGALTKEGAGTTVLSGANTFTGAVAVNAGTLVVTNGAALANTVAVTLSNNAGATLDVRSSETIGSLAGGGATGGTVALGANNLTLAGNANTTYGGAITGAGMLIKQGTGTLTFDRASAYGSDFDLRLEGGVLLLCFAAYTAWLLTTGL